MVIITKCIWPRAGIIHIHVSMVEAPNMHRSMRSNLPNAFVFHSAGPYMKKPGVVRLYRDNGYGISGIDAGIFGWRGRLLMRKPMPQLPPT